MGQPDSGARSDSARGPLVCVLGPTGTGKTGLALLLARAFNGVVINADSRQVYADFPILTAQPTPEERAACPHLLYGFLATTEKFSVGMYISRARQAIDRVWESGKLPILTGGTGMYIRSLLHGIADIPPVPEAVSAAWLARCAQEGPAALHQILLQKDPAYAAKIHAQDRQRILRALEVEEFTGKPLSWWHARPVAVDRYRTLALGLDMPLERLTPRLGRRITKMLEAGALREARVAGERCPDPSAPGWSGIGCREIWRCLAGELSLERAAALWLRNTRAYAKRQRTWFAREPGVEWLDAEDPDASARAARARVAAFARG